MPMLIKKKLDRTGTLSTYYKKEIIELKDKLGRVPKLTEWIKQYHHSASALNRIGFNCSNGFKKNDCNKKVDEAFKILSENKPNILLLLETAQNKDHKPLFFDDEYEVVLNNTAIELDN